jgi:two-component system sensor histidine kinase ChiS
MSVAADMACDLAVHKGWRVMSFASAGALALLAVASVALDPVYLPFISTGAMLFLAVHALASTPFFIVAAGKAPAASRLIGGSVPWGLVWAAAGALSAARLFGVDTAAFLDGYAGPATAAADGLMGVAVLLAVMLELARPSPEDTALQDYAALIDVSIKRFIPVEFLEHLQKPDFMDLCLGDHVKKDMTIFFSDIRAFTELSERLTPEESFAFINSYLSRVVPIINAHGGFIDKYMGDGIMALFEENGGADQAVESAVEMQTKMIEYNGHRAKMSYRPISMGIGIHTGPLMLGVVGVPGRMEGTVISDAVNLSSRLQSIAKAFNIPLVISERTFMQLQDPGKYKYRFIGKVRVKGKDAPVSVFEIFDGLPADIFERKMKSNTYFEQGMLAYYQKDYSQGVFYFKRALESVPDDGASRFYLETCLRKAMSPAKAVEI